MARTKSSTQPQWRPDRCELLQLMGFPRQGDITPDVTEVQADWPAVIERLSSHPNEAMHCIVLRDTIDRNNERRFPPLKLALVNEKTPVTREALEALVRAHPRELHSLDLENADDFGGSSRQRVENADIIKQAKRTYLGHDSDNRSITFQLMGFPASCDEPHKECFYDEYRGGSYLVDWPKVEGHLEEHPEEAKVMCPTSFTSGGECLLFPLEAALKIAHPHVPLSTVQLLLKLYPEVVDIPDSTALYYACCLRKREDPDVIRAVLSANPALAASGEHDGVFQIWENMGLPIHEAVRLPCALEILPDLIEAHPASLEALTDTFEQTPLQVAAELSSRLPTGVLRILLQHGHRHGACAGRHPGGPLFVVADDSYSAMDYIMDAPGMIDEPRLSENLRVAMQAAGAFRTGVSAERMWEYPLLHAAVEFGRRRKFIFERVYAETDRQDRNRVDAIGRTPLAVAIESAHSKQNNDYGWDDEKEEDFLKLDTVISRLLDGQIGWPQSGSIPVPSDDDKYAPSLPLHKALHQGICLEDGSGHILNAFPTALSIPDPVTELIPCLLAAVGERSSVKTIFGLMIKRPDLIIDLCEHCSEGGHSNIDTMPSKRQKYRDL